MNRQPPTFLSVAPLIPTGGPIDESVAFFTKHMGFAVLWQGGNMAGIRRGEIIFLLVENSNREWADNASFSIGVSDLDALYAEYKNVPANVGPLEEKCWGRREFHMVIPSGVCLQFFQHEKQS
jgi:catechol 2,3-dioxygenase-like lactoylglutathione lyase family enzyme